MTNTKTSEDGKPTHLWERTIDIQKMTSREMEEESLALLRKVAASPTLFHKGDPSKNITIEIVPTETDLKRSAIALVICVGTQSKTWVLASDEKPLDLVVESGIRAIAEVVSKQIRDSKFKF